MATKKTSDSPLHSVLVIDNMRPMIKWMNKMKGIPPDRTIYSVDGKLYKAIGNNLPYNSWEMGASIINHGVVRLIKAEMLAPFNEQLPGQAQDTPENRQDV